MDKKNRIATGLLLLASTLVLPSCTGKTPQEDAAPGSAPESPIVADLRRFLEAEKVYAARNKGFFGEPPCLSSPGQCLSGYDADGPRFLDPEQASMSMRYGYALTFLPGPFLLPEEREKHQVSDSSLHAFAVVAAPTIAGQPSYCADSTGLLCVRADGKMTRPYNGKCPDDCPPLK
jgi:hypothetical protein